MRAAPLAFVLDPDVAKDRTRIRDICRITHHSDEAYIGALAIIQCIRLVVFGNHPLDVSVLMTISKAIPDSRVRDRIVDVEQALSRRRLLEVARQFGSSAFVAQSVPLAIAGACVHGMDDFVTMMRALIECGGCNFSSDEDGSLRSPAELKQAREAEDTD